MYISYVNTGRPANKCHDASQNLFSNHPKSRTSNYLFVILIILIVNKILILQSSPKNLYPCDQNYLQKQNMFKKFTSTEGKLNYTVDHAANFKQQRVSCRLKCLDQRETC